MKRIIMGASVLLLAGCATKSYPTITPLTGFEVTNMSCQDLAMEMAKTEEYEAQIKQEGKLDIDTVTGVLIDGGLRNAFAHDDAKRDLERRRESIGLAISAKDC